MGLMNELTAAIAEMNPGYFVTYEEAGLMNVRADGIPGRDNGPAPCGFIYIEEFRGGSYETDGYRFSRRTRLNVYFCKLIPELENNAAEREEQREEIEFEAVLPMVRALRSGQFMCGVPKVEKIVFVAPPPRFDAHEVSIMLEFDLITPLC